MTVMDTCDGRLAAKGLALLRHDLGDQWHLIELDQGAVQAVGSPARPAFKRRLEKVAGDRPLLPWGQVSGQAALLPVLDAADKQVARLHVAAIKAVPQQGKAISLGQRVWVEPLRGYQKAALQLVDTLSHLDNLTPLPGTIYAELIVTVLPDVARPNARLQRLSSDMPTAAAWGQFMRRQLAVMEANEPGVLTDVHLECLHDFRVALRRARTASKALAAHLPPQALTLEDGFRQLSDITGPLRDLDVHLADFPAMLKLTPKEPAECFDPMLDILHQRRAAALAAVVAELQSQAYQDFKAAWRQSVAVAADHPAPPLGPVAGEVIWKTYKRIIRDGAAITPASPPEDLHDLRKKCKRLRYLLEFFQDLAVTSALVKALKTLQDCLGAHQDYAVQHDLVREIRLALSAADVAVPKATIAALAHLEAVLSRRQEQARSDFTALFEDFAARKIRARFRRAVAAHKKGEAP